MRRIIRVRASTKAADARGVLNKAYKQLSQANRTINSAWSAIGDDSRLEDQLSRAQQATEDAMEEPSQAIDMV